MRALLFGALALTSCAAPAQLDLWQRGPGRPGIYVDDAYYATQRGPWVGERQTGGYGGFEVFAGFRALPREAFGRVRTQPLWGGNLLVPIDDGPFAVELGASFSRDKDESGGDTVTLDGRVFEASVGLRLAFNAREGTLVPYLGGGVTTLYARLEDEVLDELRDDTTVGLYGRAGLAVFVGAAQYIALEWRGVRGTDVDLFSTDVDVDYDQVTVVFGTSW